MKLFSKRFRRRRLFEKRRHPKTFLLFQQLCRHLFIPRFGGRMFWQPCGKTCQKQGKTGTFVTNPSHNRHDGDRPASAFARA
ncbi:hypothetical protein CFR75_08015 [Komagataeibacter xylinus]|uniref:Uncharacterized protein n=1 Tax=Komagataeibacter xylinus TaxID=28448 RepID=A0A318PLW1_KOMXY|nr:hypothetical protein CFR75_08015 [Komagataeibacter xylinus]